VVICLEQGANLHMAQLMLLPLTISCFIKSRLVLPFWYRLTWVDLEKGLLNGCVCVCACVCFIRYSLTLSFQALNLPHLKPFFLEILPIAALVSFFQN